MSAKKKSTGKLDSMNKHLSREDLIGIQEEAFYRALKRIKTEEQSFESFEPIKVASPEKGSSKMSFGYKILFVLKTLLLPTRPKNFYADDLLRTTMSFILYTISFSAYLIGIFSMIVTPIMGMIKVFHFSTLENFYFIIFGFIITMFSALFRGAYYEVSGPMPPSQLYAYTGSLTASISVLISIFALCLNK